MGRIGEPYFAIEAKQRVMLRERAPHGKGLSRFHVEEHSEGAHLEA